MLENKKRVIPSREAKIALDQMKAEIARELSIPSSKNKVNNQEFKKIDHIVLE